MTSRRYRFSSSPGSHQYFDSPTAATLDGAIEEAKRIARATKSDTYKVFVSDTETVPHVVRGFAAGRVWTWMKKCRACSGAGVISGSYMGRAVNAPCEKCDATGAVPDV